MEHKQTEATVTAIDEAQGIVEAIWAVMGNVDEGKDIIHPGAFTKTFNERGSQIKLLDNHRTDSVLSALGTVKELKELRRNELPQPLLDRYPDATGGAWGKFQFLLDTPEGKGAFTRIQHGAVKEWSFGYDAIDKDNTIVNKAGQRIPVRNLRQVRLYEVSPVLFGMNEATTTTSAKSDNKAVTRSEGDGAHPASHYLIVEDPEKTTTWHLRVRGMDGKPDHTLMGAAWAALHGGYRGNKYEGPGKQEAISKLTSLYNSEDLPTPGGKSMDFLTALASEATEEELHKMIYVLGETIGECIECEDSPDGKMATVALSLNQFTQAVMAWADRAIAMQPMVQPTGTMSKAGRMLNQQNARRIRAAVDNLHQCLKDAGLMDDDTGSQSENTPSTSNAKEAGTGMDDSTRLLKLIEIEQESLKLLEV
jgi:phage head maturation protease